MTSSDSKDFPLFLLDCTLRPRVDICGPQGRLGCPPLGTRSSRAPWKHVSPPAEGRGAESFEEGLADIFFDLEETPFSILYDQKKSRRKPKTKKGLKLEDG